MFGFLDVIARRLIRRGLRRGLLEGNLLWLAIGAAVGVARLLLRPERPKVQRETLDVGETITVRHVGSTSRRTPRDDLTADTT